MTMLFGTLLWALLPVCLFAFSTTTTTTPKQKHYASLKDIRQEMHQIYQDLVDHPGPLTRTMTPTLRFSYVSPPINGTSTWRPSQVQVPSQLEQLEQVQQPNTTDKNKPIAIYLPGLDGTGISAFSHQFDDLAHTFELWRLVIRSDDRSDFSHLLRHVVDFVRDHAAQRDVVLIGESFGGVLASAVALTLSNNSTQNQNTNVKGLCLVNPATSFHETNWDTIVPLLASLQYLSDNTSTTTTTTLYSVVGGMALSYLIPDTNQLTRIVDLLWNTVGLIPPTDASMLLEDLTSLLEILEERLPADTLQHRVSQWLGVGTHLVNERLSQLKIPTLVVAGDQDRIMPSNKEVQRLAQVIPFCEKLVVRGRGHFVLDENVNLTEAILYSNIDPLRWKQDNNKPAYDPITDWTPPPRQEVAAIIRDQVQPLRNVHSPVFFSTDSRGKRWKGLSKLPINNNNNNNPILFVANHQFFGLDLNIIIAQLLDERNLVCRGLAHPIVFNQTQHAPELRGRTPGLLSSVSARPGAQDGVNSFSQFQKFGAIAVTPRNYYRLLESGQHGLLFPGGVRDVFQTDPSYPLLWPDKPDFVRTAAKFNATIVPLSAVGMLESARVLVEAKDLERLPFVGQRIRETGGFPAARFDAAEGARDPLPPIPLPAMPQRNYFVFGKPFYTEHIDPRDRDACAQLYREVVAETRRGLDDILRVRKDDPFQDTPRRLLYERLTNKQAPTFGIDKVNQKFII